MHRHNNFTHHKLAGHAVSSQGYGSKLEVGDDRVKLLQGCGSHWRKAIDDRVGRSEAAQDGVKGRSKVTATIENYDERKRTVAQLRAAGVNLERVTWRLRRVWSLLTPWPSLGCSPDRSRLHYWSGLLVYQWERQDPLSSESIVENSMKFMAMQSFPV